MTGVWRRYLTSAYPFGMIFALSIWPQLSDSMGRRPVLAMSLVGVGLGFIAQVRVPLCACVRVQPVHESQRNHSDMLRFGCGRMARVGAYMNPRVCSLHALSPGEGQAADHART